jgi:hypothetical protein
MGERADGLIPDYVGVIKNFPEFGGCGNSILRSEQIADDPSLVTCFWLEALESHAQRDRYHSKARG